MCTLSVSSNERGRQVNGSYIDGTRGQLLQNFLLQGAANAIQYVSSFRVYIVVGSRGEDRVTARPSMCDNLRLKHPFSCFVSGPSSSDKSLFCMRFLHHLYTTEHTFDGCAIWCYSERIAVRYLQLAGTKNFRYNEGVPAEFDNAEGQPCLII